MIFTLLLSGFITRTICKHFHPLKKSFREGFICSVKRAGGWHPLGPYTRGRSTPIKSWAYCSPLASEPPAQVRWGLMLRITTRECLLVLPTCPLLWAPSISIWDWVSVLRISCWEPKLSDRKQQLFDPISQFYRLGIWLGNSASHDNDHGYSVIVNYWLGWVGDPQTASLGCLAPSWGWLDGWVQLLFLSMESQSLTCVAPPAGSWTSHMPLRALRVSVPEDREKKEGELAQCHFHSYSVHQRSCQIQE